MFRECDKNKCTLKFFSDFQKVSTTYLQQSSCSIHSASFSSSSTRPDTMGNDITLHRGRRPTNIDLQERLLSISKQSKKSKASKIASRQCTPRPPRRRLPQLSIDLDLTNDDMLDSPVCAPNEIISWNCHHSLKMIGSDLVKLRYKLNRWKSTGTNSVSQQQRFVFSFQCDICFILRPITISKLESI